MCKVLYFLLTISDLENAAPQKWRSLKSYINSNVFRIQCLCTFEKSCILQVSFQGFHFILIQWHDGQSWWANVNIKQRQERSCSGYIPTVFHENLQIFMCLELEFLRPIHVVVIVSFENSTVCLAAVVVSAANS